MANKQQSKRAAHPKQNKTIFVIRMIRIIDQPGTLVKKDGFGFIEAHSMLLQIGSGFSAIPFEAQCAHMKV
jgi:hypothetical protein